MTVVSTLPPRSKMATARQIFLPSIAQFVVLAISLEVLFSPVAQAQASANSLSSAGAPAVPQAGSDVTTDKLKKTRKALDKARNEATKLKNKAANLEQDIVRIRDGLVAAARIIQHHEARIAEIEDRLKAVDSRQAEFRKVFVQRRKQLGFVLAALQRMARNPPEALIAQPVSPADTVRSAILLRSALPTLERHAQTLRLDLEVLADARNKAEEQRREFDTEMQKLDGQRLILRRLLGRKSRLRRRTVLQTTRAAGRAKSLSKEAASLLDLVTRLDALRDQRETAAKQQAAREQQHLAALRRQPGAANTKLTRPARPAGPPSGYTGASFQSAKGRMLYPVVGRVVAQYGQAIAKGRSHKGLTIETGVSAQVVAPFEGKIAFSGPFRGYGQLLIIEHRGGYHTLLAGMARIDVVVGQWALLGEPIGIMGRTSARKPALYIEIRKKGQPINPLPWLAARKGKVSG